MPTIARSDLPCYLVGVDLGQRQDYTAIVVLRQFPDLEPEYRLLHAERWRGRPYRHVVERLRWVDRMLHEAIKLEVARLVGSAWAIHPDIDIVVDHTGVGRPVTDDIIRGSGIRATGVTITSGTSVTRHGQDWHVAKSELIGRLEVVFQNGRLRYPSADRLPAVDILAGELENFRRTKTKLGNDTYGAAQEWRDGNHDDLVLAAALAVWYGEEGSQRPQLRIAAGVLKQYLDAQM